MQVIFILSLLVLFAFFLFSPETVFTATQSGIELWAKELIPSLLPFFILNDMLESSGGIRLLGRPLKRPFKALFGLPGESTFWFLTAYSTGVPVAARLVAEGRKAKTVTKKQGDRLLAFTANVSPAFLLSVVAFSLLGEKELGPYLAGLHYGTNLFLTVICLLTAKEKNSLSAQRKPALSGRPSSFFTLFQNALFRSLRTMVLIGAIVTGCFLLMAFFKTVGLSKPILDGSPLSNTAKQGVTSFCAGLLEITAGTKAVTETVLPLQTKIALLSGFLAFGGLSAALQIRSVIAETDLSLRFYFRYKALQGSLAFFLAWKFPPTFLEAAVFHGETAIPPGSVPVYWGILPFGAGICALMISLLRDAGER